MGYSARVSKTSGAGANGLGAGHEGAPASGCADSGVDDVGSIMARSGDDVFRQVDDFHVANYLDDLRVKNSALRIEAAEHEEPIFLDLGRGAADLAVDAIQVATDDER